MAYTEATAESQDPFEGFLLKKYKPPASSDMVITQQSVGTGLNRHNYVHKMHRLLEIEEIKRAQIIASYSHEAEVELHSFIEEEGAIISCRSGELFAKVPLNEQLNEDTDAGKLILTSVKAVLLAPTGSTDKKVYEAVMVTKENFDYDGRGRDYIYICLSPRCVHDLELVGGDYLNIQMQFQMDRLPFCRMHFAVDQLENTDVVFPDVSRIDTNWNETRVYRISSQVLNADQLNVVEHILAERTTYSPPIVVYGPFGTGKTETLAQAAMLLVKKNFESRVLICTHSNSAADLYILKHFDSFVKNNPDINILRVYSCERRLSTVPAQVKKYCLLSKDKQTIMLPLREDILSHHIVITTLSTSLNLSQIRDLKGFFSHLFIDEAAQALECEAIMPLSLATDTTCVVLAGDHMQLFPKIYSQEAKLQMFHKSLLERLYQHYDNYHRAANGTSPLNILLSINYRTKMEILRFISALFYGSPDRLHEASGLPDATGFTPLTFYTAYGKEIQDPDSTTYYNMAEVEEVVSRVIELYENWPPEWGERRPESIGVFSPYTEQVNRIRVHLRKKRLSGVTVDRVMNIQGKEFRAIFLSTVRTIHLVDKPPEITKAVTECDGDVGDFGFLSDNKLLNTALTRARSFIGVIGDPMALCAIGECVLTWRAYLKHCQQLKSIKPETVTLQGIRTEVESLMKSPKGQNLQMLNNLSELIKERKQAIQIAEPQHLAAASSSKVSDHLLANDSSNQLEAADLVMDMNEDWSSGHEVKTDNIIKQLAVDALKVCQLELEKSRSAVAVFSDKQNGEPLIDYVKVKEDKGHAILLYKPAWKKDPEKRQLLSADNYDDEFDSDEDLDRNDTNKQSTYVDFTHQQLLDMICKQPELYRHCILHIENSSCMYATEKEASSDIKEIKISSRSRCGHAFHGDEVVVELLHIDQEDKEILEDGNLKQGKVVGILKRMINPQYRMFVCMVEEGNTGLMVPLNRGIPKIYNLETKNHLKKTSRGHVCIYKFTRDRQIRFDHYEPVDSSNPLSKLFLVRYLKWDPKSYLPLGIVVGVLPAGTDVESGMKILDLEYYIPKKFRTDTENEVARKCSKFSIPSSEYEERMDFRDCLTFTIDPEGSEDLDDALSIESLPKGQYRIGIHIADVSIFVKKDSAVDKEARSRATSYYPVGGKPIPMLPQKLSTDLCSLKTGQDRLTMSLFIIITASAQVIDTQLQRCIINSSYQLNYEEVEDILDGIRINRQVTKDLKLALLHLHKIAQRWRKQRLGNQGLYMNLDPEASAAPKAHLLVAELMIQANHHIALLLLQRCQGSVPLRIQMPPNELALDEWRQKSAEVAKNTVILTKPYLSRGSVCSCTNQCHCIKINLDKERDVCILTDAWEQLKSVLVEEDEYSPENLVTLAANPDNCPETKLAILQYHSLQKPGVYVCSGSLPEDHQLHYDVNVRCYTHFTSPIRRYMDLVIHRLLESVLIGKSSPYTDEELTNLCNHCTDAAQRSHRYEKDTNILQLSSLIQNSPATLHCVVETVDKAQLVLRIMHLKPALHSFGHVAMSLLGLSERPSITEESVIVKWEERIYDLDVDPSNIVDSKQEAMLNPYRLVVRIPAEDWRRLLFAMIQGNSQDMLLSLLAANEKLESTVSDRYVEDITCELQHIPGNRLFCRFSLEIQPASVMKVQVNSNMFRGLLAPRMQLLELTDNLNICLEHRADPSLCFASNTTLQASKPQYRDEESYKSAWLRLLAIESAHEAVNSGDRVTIRGVFISWNKSNEAVIGTVMLPLKFCKDRKIIFNTEVMRDDQDYRSQQPLDYFCIQYPSISPPTPEPDWPTEKFDFDFEQPFTWVGHCVSVDCKKSAASRQILLTLRLHQHSIPMPDVLLLNNTELKATVELIPKSSSSRNQEKAIKDICDATPLARSIALGQKVPELDIVYQEALKEYKSKQVPHLPEPNHSQQFAISNALTQSFSLIQGPPGTGKTVTGVRIAYLLCQFNCTQPADKGIQPQLLYCGPSNKSVDVVTAYLLKLGKSCPRLVRIYSETIEQEEFPLPGDVVCQRHRRQQAYTISEDIKHVALHHMVREPSHCSQAMTIVDFDERIRKYKAGDHSIEPVDPEMYAEVLLSAMREVLKSCQIVLSTCNGSASKRVKCETNIKQLIIDESGMCTEPESILPIIVSQAQQVILIGDHKQLQPIVLNKQAKNLGLNKSLFERYAGKAYMLTQQYRMHQAIAEFPSQHFYEGRLECGSDEQTKPSQLKFWPNGRGKPFCFVHIMGREETLTVTTTDGSEQSKTNLEEVTQAVRAATLLVRRFHINPQEVVVLSQYRAQCSEIQKALLLRGEKDINVSTVVSAQGSEWDYVILSTVRSLPKAEIERHPTNGWRQRKLGFITDHHQINVAITRARKGLIIIGNKHLLGCDNMWKNLLMHYEKNHKVIDASEFMT